MGKGLIPPDSSELWKGPCRGQRMLWVLMAALGEHEGFGSLLSAVQKPQHSVHPVPASLVLKACWGSACLIPTVTHPSEGQVGTNQSAQIHWHLEAERWEKQARPGNKTKI